MNTLKIIFIVVFFGLFISSCGKKEEIKEQEIIQHEKMEYHAGMEEIKKSVEQQGELVIRKAHKDEIGKVVTCPVMGIKFKVKSETSVADYNGKSYYLCCQACIDAIKKNPQKYIK